MLLTYKKIKEEFKENSAQNKILVLNQILNALKRQLDANRTITL